MDIQKAPHPVPLPIGWGEGGPAVRDPSEGFPHRVKITALVFFVLALVVGVRAEPKSVSLPRDLDKLVPSLMTQHKVPGVGIVGIEKQRVAWERYYGVRTA